MYSIYSGSLPAWWTSRFPHYQVKKKFDLDRIDGCMETLYLNGTCFGIHFGVDIWATSASSESDCFNWDPANPTGTRHVYVSSDPDF